MSVEPKVTVVGSGELVSYKSKEQERAGKRVPYIHDV